MDPSGVNSGGGIFAAGVTTYGLAEAIINFSSSGNNTIVVGVIYKLIRVYKIFFIVGAATNITPQDGASTALTGPMDFSANEGMVLDFDDVAWYTLSFGNDFVINSSNAVQVSGRVYYTQGAQGP